MPISESLINTTGTFTQWAGGGITATASGITTTSSNSYAKSSASMTSSNTYQRISFSVYWNGAGYIGVGLSWGDWSNHQRVQINTDGTIGIEGTLGKTSFTSSGLSAGTYDFDFEYDDGTIKFYIDGVEKKSMSGDLSSYTDFKPMFWIHDSYNFIRSYEEITDSTSVTITPDALALTSVINDGTISTVRNITTELSEQTLTSSQPALTVVFPKNITVVTTVQSLTTSQPNITVYPLAETTTASSVIFIANREKLAVKLNSNGSVYWELD